MPDILFESKRLYFRPPKAEDATAMFEAAVKVWPELRKWMNWTVMEEYSLEDAQYYISTICHDDIDKGGLPLFGFCKKTGNFVIASGLTHSHDKHVYSTGYWVAQDYLGKGYATEATKAVLNYAFNDYAAKKVTISYFDGNEKSRRIIEKCGFEFIETLPNAHRCFANDELVNEHCYAITIDEWKKVQ